MFERELHGCDLLIAAFSEIGNGVMLDFAAFAVRISQQMPNVCLSAPRALCCVYIHASNLSLKNSTIKITIHYLMATFCKTPQITMPKAISPLLPAKAPLKCKLTIFCQAPESESK